MTPPITDIKKALSSPLIKEAFCCHKNLKAKLRSSENCQCKHTKNYQIKTGKQFLFEVFVYNLFSFNFFSGMITKFKIKWKSVKNFRTIRFLIHCTCLSLDSGRLEYFLIKILIYRFRQLFFLFRRNESAIINFCVFITHSYMLLIGFLWVVSIQNGKFCVDLPFSSWQQFENCRKKLLIM